MMQCNKMMQILASLVFSPIAFSGHARIEAWLARPMTGEKMGHNRGRQPAFDHSST
jgi:hypothetical protein